MNLPDYRGQTEDFRAEKAADVHPLLVSDLLQTPGSLKLQRVPTRPPVKQPPFQVHAAYLAPLAA